jgi:hypothetical protein
VVVRDDAVLDAKTYKSRLYHIYNDDEVKDDFNRKARATQEPLHRELGCDHATRMISDWTQPDVFTARAK